MGRLCVVVTSEVFMNIALFLDCWTPMKNGVITSAQQLREDLEKRGHHVIVLSILQKGYVNTDPNVLLFPVINFDFGSKQGFGPAKVHQKRVLEFLQEHKIELVHCHTEFSLGFAAKRAAIKLKIPRVTTTHTMWEMYGNYTPLLKVKAIWRTYFRTFMRGTSVIVAPSVKAKRYNQLVNPKYPVQVVPNGIDTAKFRLKNLSAADLAEVRTRYRFDSADRILIFVGRLGPEKRVKELLGALIPYLQRSPQTKIVFVGDGPARTELTDKAKQANVAPQVVFTGFVDWSEVYKLYSISNLFVTASLSEVHPMTLIEGAICNLPSVARRDDSFVDLIRDGVNGYLVDTDEELGTRVAELLDDKTKLAQFAKAAGAIAKTFSAENHVSRMERLYQKVMQYYPDRLELLASEDLLPKLGV